LYQWKILKKAMEEAEAQAQLDSQSAAAESGDKKE
jgi:hypothetical protein